MKGHTNWKKYKQEKKNPWYCNLRGCNWKV